MKKRLNARISPENFTGKPVLQKGYLTWLFRQIPDGTLFTAMNPRSNAFGYWCRKTAWNEAEVLFPCYDNTPMPKEEIISVRDLTTVRVSQSDEAKYLKHSRENG